MEAKTAKSDFVTAMQNAMLEKFKELKKNLIPLYHKYRGYYDRKAFAQPLKVHSICLLLNSLLTTQSDFGSKSMQVWIPLFRVEKVLTSSNYIIRKVGTTYPQCVHRIRLRAIDPQHQPDDVEPIDPAKFQTVPLLRKYRSEPGFFDNYLPRILDDIQLESSGQNNDPISPARVQLSVPLGLHLAASLIPVAPIRTPPSVPLPVRQPTAAASTSTGPSARSTSGSSARSRM